MHKAPVCPTGRKPYQIQLPSRERLSPLLQQAFWISSLPPSDGTGHACNRCAKACSQLPQTGLCKNCKNCLIERSERSTGSRENGCCGKTPRGGFTWHGAAIHNPGCHG